MEYALLGVMYPRHMGHQEGVVAVQLTREEVIKILHNDVCKGYYSSDGTGRKLHNFRHMPYPPCESIADQIFGKDKQK